MPQLRRRGGPGRPHPRPPAAARRGGGRAGVVPALPRLQQPPGGVRRRRRPLPPAADRQARPRPPRVGRRLAPRGQRRLGSAPLLVVDPRDAVAWRLDEPRVAALADRLAATWPCARLDVAPDGFDALVIGREADSSPAVAFRDEHGAIALVEIVALPPQRRGRRGRRPGRAAPARVLVPPAPRAARPARALPARDAGRQRPRAGAAAVARGLALAIPWRGGSVAVAAARIVADDLVATAVRLAPSARLSRFGRAAARVRRCPCRRSHSRDARPSARSTRPRSRRPSRPSRASA